MSSSRRLSPLPSTSNQSTSNNNNNNRRRSSRSRSPNRNNNNNNRDNRDINRRRDDRDDRDDRDRRRDRDNYDDRRSGNGGNRDRDRRDDRRRENNNDDNSKPSTSASSSSSSSALSKTKPISTEIEGGDGGWGSKSKSNNNNNNSPGRPSLALPSQASLTGTNEESEIKPVKIIEPNFGASGALAAETNTFQGVVLKYNEPPEARKPIRSWRLYVFKGKEQVDLFHVHKQSAYLFGRDRIVADIPIDHPSSSKQHAVLQFRQVIERNEFGETKSLTKPFIIDLDSANGTTVNDEQVPTSRYYELKSNDVLKFAFSTREYVLLAET